jgi:hypothetical protein
MNTDKTSIENESQPSCLGAVMGSLVKSLNWINSPEKRSEIFIK